MDKNVFIERNPGISGAMNEGTWILRGRDGKDLVLKMVSSSRRRAGELTEAECFLKLDREHATISSDKSLAFPIKILHVDSKAHGRAKDLIVMRKAPGEALALVMARMKRDGQDQELLRIFERIGESVGSFHKRYGGKQHGDLHGSNIFYDEVSRRVTLIDLRDMGCQRKMTDIEYFAHSLRLVAATYPQVDQYIRHFQKGYATGMRKSLEKLERRHAPLQRLHLAVEEASSRAAPKPDAEHDTQEDEDAEEEDEREEEQPGGLERFFTILKPLIHLARSDPLSACGAREDMGMDRMDDEDGEIMVKHVRSTIGCGVLCATRS
jgi:tRNA A-37 threonylcarbamoyl transferase component Bud32